MPDVWETAHGLNPNSAADGSTVGASGYTHVEEYLNGIGQSNGTPAPTANPGPIPGDANGDKHVDETDYTIWLCHYNNLGNCTFKGDLNGDGAVDGIDYSIWLTSFGKY
jgi:hypothetical protein